MLSIRKEIKTREVKKDIRVLDKAGTAAERIREATIRTKDAAERSQSPQETSANDYAVNRTSDYADRAAHGAARQVQDQSRRAVQKVKACLLSTSVVNNLSTFIFGLVRAVGMILIGYGIVQIGLSLKSHDPSQRANGIMTVAGGIVVTFAKEILNTIAG